MGTPETHDAAVFAVATQILATHGGREAAAWSVAEHLVATTPLRDLFIAGITDAVDLVHAANEAERTGR